MLDEPFSALDYVSRLSVSDDVANIIKNENKTVIMITHDIAEAISLADRVIVLSKRPASIKNIYEINLSTKSNPIENRKAKEFSKYFVKKGSIAIDGISLTIADCTNDTNSIAVIPHTYENTIMSTYKENDSINIEFDILAKYVEKNLLMNDNKSNITEDFLKANGFV